MAEYITHSREETVALGQRAGAAVIVDDGKGGAADRVGAAQPLGQALTKGGLARAQTAGEGNQCPVRQHCRQHSMDTYGADDLVWYNAQGGKRPHAAAAYPLLFGDVGVRLIEPNAAPVPQEVQQAA